MVSINCVYFLCFICSSQLSSIQSVNNETFKHYFAALHNENDDTTLLTKSIFHHCFESNNLVLTHRVDDDVTEILKAASSKPSKLLDATSEIFGNYKRPRKVYTIDEAPAGKQNYPTSGVVINVVALANFSKTLEAVRDSIWWNSESTFLVIDRNPRGRCEASSHLKTLWSFKVLSAVYVCGAARGDVALYTFNPFANLAPAGHWREVHAAGDQTWTLFRLRLRGRRRAVGPELCRVLYFDKGARLDGYRLRVELAGAGGGRYVHVAKHGARCVDWPAEVIFDVLAQLNATVDVKSSSETSSYIDEGGNPRGLLVDIHEEKIDIIIDQFYLRSFWKLMAYPVFYPFNYVLYLETPVSFRTKLSFFFRWNFWLVVAFTCATCIVMLKYALEDDDYLAVALKFVQIMFSTPDVGRPRYFYLRLLLYLVFAVTSTTNALMQLHLNWWSSLPKYERSLQSDEDLTNSNLTFYGYHYIKDLVPSKFAKKFKGFNDFNACLEMLNSGEEVACIADEFTLDKSHWQSNPLIYNLRNSLFDRSASFTYTEDFPLAYKLNLFLQRMREGGLIEFIYSRFLITKNQRRRHEKVRKAALAFESMGLKKLSVCVYVLTVGWTTAAVAFFSELLTSTTGFRKFIRLFRKVKMSAVAKLIGYKRNFFGNRNVR